ncbi:unnamed protein product [Aureobasidium uvarum]|uniref:Uncharacterized protein n=1 Tax=Aureobasidium uvarum TaxID=2773716 RepID=A0A9N8KR11_9PEZI|nr:unnamed protein product [Aureobasidium uvarum]
MAVQKSNRDIVRMLLAAGAKRQLDEVLEIALVKIDAEIVQLLKDFGAVEHDDGFGLEELMEESAYKIVMDEETQTMAGAENLDERPV